MTAEDQPTTPFETLSWLAARILDEGDRDDMLARGNVAAKICGYADDLLVEPQNVDPVRACALEAAARWLATENGGSKPNDVIGAALAFEDYLRGGGDR